MITQLYTGFKILVQWCPPVKELSRPLVVEGIESEISDVLKRNVHLAKTYNSPSDIL